ncbi:dienelactone hydrolase-like protein [Cryomyces antarcticus]
MPATQLFADGKGFLSTLDSHAPPKLYITGETGEDEAFDQLTLRQWVDEGFDVTYLHFNDGGPKYKRLLQSGRWHGTGREVCYTFGDAASEVLEAFLKPTAKLCALVAYYPSAIPAPGTKFPGSVRLTVHLAGKSQGVRKTPEILGIQGKRKTVRKRQATSIGTGGMTSLSYPSYVYEAEPGFAEHDLDEYDKVADRLAWTRSLATVSKGFGAEVELEKIWEEHVELEFSKKNAEATMSTMVATPYVNHVPTLTGGIGGKDLARFYAHFFIPANPPSLSMRLVSRTIGVDRVVDELVLSFTHTQPMPWMLPGVPATHKRVEIALVSVVCIRGGKLYDERIYWDQASVLVQIGLLDPAVVPQKWRGKVERLPVAGREAARKVLDEESEPSNELIPEW